MQLASSPSAFQNGPAVPGSPLLSLATSALPTAPAALGQHWGSSQESSLKRQNSTGHPCPGLPPSCGSCSQQLAPRGDPQRESWVSANRGAPHWPQTAGPWSFQGQINKSLPYLNHCYLCFLFNTPNLTLRHHPHNHRPRHRNGIFFLFQVNNLISPLTRTENSQLKWAATPRELDLIE